MDNAELLRQLRIDRHQRDVPSVRSKKPWLLGGAAVLVALALAAAGWLFWPARALAVQTAVAVAPAADGDAGAVLQATGYVTARRLATVSAQITGTLSEVLIEEGDHVEKGQVLARLENTAQTANLNSARANAVAAQAQVAQLQTQLAQSMRDADRDQALAARGLVSKQIAEQAMSQVLTQRAQVNAAQRTAQASQTTIAVAQVASDYTVVRAPFTGVITDKAAQVGEIVSPLSAGGGFTRTGVGTIVDMDSLEIDVDVNEAFIGRVTPAMPCDAVLDAYPDWHMPAHVIAIVPTADRGKATVKVRVAIEKKDARIVPDMGVRVAFLEHRQEPAALAPKGMLVPAAAVVQRDGRAVVFVVADGHARRVTPDQPPSPLGELRLLASGVRAGDTVILAPPSTLRDGQAVDTQTHD